MCVPFLAVTRKPMQPSAARSLFKNFEHQGQESQMDDLEVGIEKPLAVLP